jgi:hypothetical protein
MRSGMKRLAVVLLLPAITLAVVLGVRALGGSHAAARSGQVGSGSAAAQATTTCPFESSLIGRVTVPAVPARTSPDTQGRVIAWFHRTNPQGSPQVFLIDHSPTSGWVRALLPLRPNGTEGFLPTNALSFYRTSYHLAVSRAALRLTLYQGCSVARTFPVGIGKGSTPTPVGTFYLASLMQPPTPNTIYGAFAYGLSGYSNVIRNWRWGGVVGLHGTNDPSSVGQRVSHGCIRMLNRDIESLVRILPLGTPIVIS